MPLRALIAFYRCAGCGEETEGTWPGEEPGDEQDRAEAPVAVQECPCGHRQTETYPGWSLYGEAG